MKVLERQNFSHRQLVCQRSGEEFSRSAILSAETGAKDLFIHHEILLPGKRCSSPHFHSKTDEFVYVLKGRPTAVEGLKVVELSIGSCLCFPANSGLPHFLENRTHEDVELLVVCKQLDESDVVYSQSPEI
jgi:uncharacterized cupin superfamily protein